MLLIHIALLAVAAQAAKLTLDKPVFTISSSNGTKLRSEELPLTNKPFPPLVVGPDDILKLTFQVMDKKEKVGVQPHQTFLRFYDKESGEEGIQPIRVTSSGKAKFELNMAKPPLSLPPTSNKLITTTVIIGSFVHSPLKIDLFDVALPPSHPAPQHPDEPRFHPLPEIHHTFRPDPKLPPKFISAFFAVLVLSPWVVLLGLWSQVAPGAPRLFSPSILPFIVALGAFEGLLVWYWVALKLPDVLLYGAILALPTVFAGKTALASIAGRRLGRK